MIKSINYSYITQNLTKYKNIKNLAKLKKINQK